MYLSLVISHGESFEEQVTSYELRVASCEVRGAGCGGAVSGQWLVVIG